jgi:hypothetical protein
MLHSTAPSGVSIRCRAGHDGMVIGQAGIAA